jgi:HSP20 family protein
MQVKVATASRKPEAQHNQPGYPISPFRMFEDFFNDWVYRSAGPQAEGFKPAVDILEKDGNLILCVELAGVDEKDIDLKLEASVLTIKGERRPEPESDKCTWHQVESSYGAFSRSFSLPDTVDTEKISANFKNGVLVVSLPQKPEVKPRSIKVTI